MKIPPTPFEKKDENDEQATGEKQPLLGGLFTAHKKQAENPSQEHRLGPNDLVRVWDVTSPPVAKATMVHGKLMPTITGLVVGNLHHVKGRVTIEVHSDKPDENEEQAEGSTDGVTEGLLRGKSTTHGDNEVLRDEEYIMMRIFRPAAGSGFGLFGGKHDKNQDKDDSVVDDKYFSSLSLSSVDKEFKDGKWVEAYLFALADIEVLKRRRRTVEMKLGLGEDTHVRDLVFANVQEALTFCSVLESLNDLSKGRGQRRLEAYQANPNAISRMRDIGSTFQLLVEIVSAARLPVLDFVNTDAFVVVNLGKEEVHRTRDIPNTLNPIWTLDSGSLFMLETTPEKFFASGDGLAFNVFQYDILGEHELLGRVFVMPEEVCEGNGERIEYPLILNSKYKDTRGTKLVLRFRLATYNDLAFMRAFNAQKKKQAVGAYADEAYVPIGVASGKLIKREKKITTHGKIEYRVKPGPDPDRVKETTWMTKEQIDAEAQKPSQSWIKAGSGTLGKLYFELIGCDGLPNMDKTPLHVTGGKTDAYAAIIYEDSIVNTDVVMDALCPRWLPWTQRAFVFNIMHPSNQLMLAILSFTGGTLDYVNPIGRTIASNKHIGRVTMDFSNMRPGTDYTLQFDLTTTALVSTRSINGTVTVRVRIEWENERTTLLRSIIPPPEIYVNVSEQNDFDACHYAIVGECDTKIFSMDTIASYVEELQGYKALVPVLKSAMFTVLLWRGHLPVTFVVPSIPPRNNTDESLFRRLFQKVTIKLPLHSLILFLVGIHLVEDYDLFPSFLCFAVAWILIASMELENSHPSPWRKKRTYWEHLQVLLFNRQLTDTIEPNESKAEVERYLAELEQQKKEQEEEEAKEAALVERDAQENEGEEVVEVEMETKKKGFGLSLYLLEPILYPVQQKLETVVLSVRFVSSFCTGKESRGHFWLVNACVVTGLLLVGIPWGFLVQWVLRIAVWTLLGPWMKLIDIFFVRGRSREELAKEQKQRLRVRYQQLVEARRSRQMKREDALKLKSIKRFMYGGYIVSVPRFKQYRYDDLPLYPSHAEPHVKASSPKIKASFRGQHLKGVMIPEREGKHKSAKVTSAMVGEEAACGSTD